MMKQQAEILQTDVCIPIDKHWIYREKSTCANLKTLGMTGVLDVGIMTLLAAKDFPNPIFDSNVRAICSIVFFRRTATRTLNSGATS